MFKLIWAVRRKPGLTFEEFRHHFETSHALLAQKYIGAHLVEYRRNYVQQVGAPAGPAGDLAARYGFDCLSEWTMADETAYAGIQQVLADPAIGGEIAEDSRKFTDGRATVVFTCTMVDTGTGGDRS